MTLVVKSDSYVRDQIAVANMLRDRKRVFVDLLKWKLAVVDDEYEIDQFDHAGAVYLICSDADGNHRGSLRLVPTRAPHILGSLFPDLCDGPVPTGPNVYELTRGCFSPRISAAERRMVRNQLATAAVELALCSGIGTFTCIASGALYSQILALGWMCEPLGLPRPIDRILAGALRIAVTRETPRLLVEAGTYVRSPLEMAAPASLAA